MTLAARVHRDWPRESAAWGPGVAGRTPRKISLGAFTSTIPSGLTGSILTRERTLAIERLLVPRAADRRGEAATRAELESLQATICDLQARLKALEEHHDAVVVVRAVSRDEAKAELLAYFREHPESYPSDAAVALSLEPALARDLAAELLHDGRLEG